MTAKPNSHSEMIEPLRVLVENLAQELTEQKFVPALRGELQQLLSSLEGLQQSQETLQQIARGVERLRDVFAPAGTRLLEGVKDVELVLKQGAGELKQRAEEMLADLVQTHQQLESALRNEAHGMGQPVAAGQEAFSRTVADVESRLSSLQGQIETVCRRLEADVTTRGTAPASASAMVVPDEFRSLLSGSTQAVRAELERQREELKATLETGRGEDRERLIQLQRRIEDALGGIAPKVQEQLDLAVSRLRDQLRTLAVAEAETRAAKGETAGKGHATRAAAPEFSAALSATEGRILGELDALRSTEHSTAERVVQELARGLEESAARHSERVAAESRTVRESLARLENTLATLGTAHEQDQDKLAALGRNLDMLSHLATERHNTDRAAHAEARQQATDQAAALTQLSTAQQQRFGELQQAVTQALQTAQRTVEQSQAESRGAREGIAAALADLRRAQDQGLAASDERMQTVLREATADWTRMTDELGTLLQRALDAQRQSLDGHLQQAAQRAEGLNQDLHRGLEQFGADIKDLRERQEQALPTLENAIRGKYDENATRLRELLESAHDRIVRQVAQVPQALERYSHLVQSLNQGQELALHAITADTKNLLSLSGEKFDVLVTDSTAIKKFFPLLDKRLDKHSLELDLLRKGQTRHEKDVGDLRASVAANRQWQDDQHRELKADLTRLREEGDAHYEAARAAIAQVQSLLKGVTDDALPGLRRDLISLVTGKFEFIENTLHERQENLRRDLFSELARERKDRRHHQWAIALLIAAGIGLQIFYHMAKTPGVGQ